MKSFFTTLCFLIGVVILFFNMSFAQDAWDDQVVGMPSVLILDNSYHMWYTDNSPQPVGSIGYVSSTDGITWIKNHDPVVTDIDDEITAGMPGNFTLSQNYPNPFNPSTTIKFQIPNSQL